MFDRLTAQRNKVGQSKYKRLERIKVKLRTAPAFFDWLDVCKERIESLRLRGHDEADKENLLRARIMVRSRWEELPS